jgi:anti-sigma-K factor RskA
VDHLASNYVLGTLSPRVSRRLEKLRLVADNVVINARIQFWEERMYPLNEKTPPLSPKPDTWKKIEGQLDFIRNNEHKLMWYEKIRPKFYQWATACSLAIIVFMGMSLMSPEKSGDVLSYVAVLVDEKQQPQIVATTYGENQILLLNIVQLPKLKQGESLELWVKSKTDFQTRSLGEIPLNVTDFSRSLSNAEWRLIKDSDSLLISIEEQGGSPIGEPLGEIISKGACIKLSDWQNQV